MSDAMELIDNFTRERRFGPVAHTKWAAVRRAFERAGWHYTTAGRCAARYRALTQCTLADAAAAFDISDATVHQAQAGLTAAPPPISTSTPPPPHHLRSRQPTPQGTHDGKRYRSDR